MDDEKTTSYEYSADRIQYGVEIAAADAGRILTGTGKQICISGRKAVIKHKAAVVEKSAQVFPKQIPSSKTSRTLKGAERMIKSTNRYVKPTTNTTLNTTKAVQEAAKATSRTAQKSATVTKMIAKNTAAAVRVASVAIASVTKAVQGANRLLLVITVGSGVAVVIVVMLAALVIGSTFGINFTGGSNSGAMTLQSVMQEIDEDFQSQIDTICGETVYDKIVTSGACAPWSDVLAVYAVKVTTDSNNPQDAVTMDASRKAILKGVFWDINTIEYDVKISEIEDGSTTVASESIQQTTLCLTITHKTTDEIALIYQFNDEQVELLCQILGKPSLWNHHPLRKSVVSTHYEETPTSRLHNL